MKLLGKPQSQTNTTFPGLTMTVELLFANVRLPYKNLIKNVRPLT